MPSKMEDMFKEFTQKLIDFYIENSENDNVYTITTRKLLLPHLHSFLHLIEKSNDKLKKVTTYCM